MTDSTAPSYKKNDHHVTRRYPVANRPASGPSSTDDDPRLAVALQYRRASDPAPRIVAKGTGELADAILTLAREHGVAVREDADLAQLLSTVELETQIPVEAFVAVAEILSYVYRTKSHGPSSFTPGGN